MSIETLQMVEIKQTFADVALNLFDLISKAQTLSIEFYALLFEVICPLFKTFNCSLMSVLCRPELFHELVKAILTNGFGHCIFERLSPAPVWIVTKITKECTYPLRIHKFPLLFKSESLLTCKLLYRDCNTAFADLKCRFFVDVYLTRIDDDVVLWHQTHCVHSVFAVVPFLGTIHLRIGKPSMTASQSMLFRWHDSEWWPMAHIHSE